MQLSAKDFKKALEGWEYILIDVRTPEELVMFWKISDNQKLIIYWTNNFVNEILALDKNKKYLIYCWHWNRSNTVVNFMKSEGFSEVYDLEGGIEAWKREN